jgi:hypothetical protein
MPDKMSHIIAANIRNKPSSMIRPSRLLNFDRFMATLLAANFSEEGQHRFGGTALAGRGSAS